MKKIISILLIICMAFSITACGSKKETVAVETIKDPVIQLTENLPTVAFTGTFEAADITNEEGRNIMYALKGGKDASIVGLVAYYWKNDSELLDIAQTEIEKNYKDQTISVSESNTFYKEGDYNYVFFTAEDSKTFDKNTTVKNYIFRDGANVYKLEVFEAK